MGMTKSKSLSFRIVAADHTGITVSNLERSLAFWRDMHGFELSHTAHQTGELAREITGVTGSEIKLAVLKTPSGHKIELLEFFFFQAEDGIRDLTVTGVQTCALPI